MTDEKQRTDKSLALTDEQHGRPQRAWDSPVAFKIAAGFLLVVAALAVWIVVSGKPGTSSPPHTAPASPPRQAQATVGSSTRTTSTTSNNSTSCSLPAGDQSVPSQAAPSGVTWGQIGSMSVPQAPQTYGPQHDDGTWAWCFAHNPTGALMAALNFWAEGTAAPPVQVFQRLAIGGPTSVSNNSRLDSGGPVQFAGYKYDSYTGTQAQINVVISGPQGKLGTFVTNMRWTGSDWKFLFPSSGEVPMEAITALGAGYVEWGQFQ